ncbi:MAG: hypothetical protein IH956_03715 [Chloroflexi bacterium]|nr:hypothetical protein [Chloroflexota bacterium]
MKDIVSAPPLDEQGPFGGEYQTLRAAARFFPDRSRPLFDLYLSHDTLQCRRAVIHALNKPEQPVPWAVQFLEPLLDDRTDTGWQYGPDYDRKPIRICDEAAKILAAHYVEGALFKYEQNPEYLDTQIAKLKSMLAGEEVTFEVEATAFLPHQVRRMAGALVDVARGKMSMDELREILNGASGGRVAHSLPPQGLCLVSVSYANFPPDGGETR